MMIMTILIFTIISVKLIGQELIYAPDPLHSDENIFSLAQTGALLLATTKTLLVIFFRL